MAARVALGSMMTALSEANGNLNLRIKLHVPEALTDEERELFRRLRDLRRH